MAKSHQRTHPVIAEVLQARDQKLQDHIHGLVSRYRSRWGTTLWRQAADPCGEPLILAVDHDRPIADFCKYALEKHTDCRVITAWNGLDMLVKVQVLGPSLIITGLNILYFYPPAYQWMLMNLDQPDPIPMLFIRGASDWRIPRQIPIKSLHLRVLGKPFLSEDIESAVEQLLPEIARP